MKINLPVTQNEIQLRDDIMIVSKTDLKGIITYVNKDFLEVSGFTEEELIGKNHNVVRHPDMPVEGFQDLWDALKAGRPWNGFVKNRTKSGDYYWVEANATPIWEGGRVTGYLSLRRKPSRAMVDAHENAYRLFREGKAKGLMISNGQAVSKAPWSRVARSWRDMSLSKKVVLACTVLLVVVMSSVTLMLGNHAATALEQDRVQDLDAKLQLIRGMIDVRAKAMNKDAERMNDIFASFFPEPFALDQQGGSPVIRNGSTVVNQRTVEVDRFTNLTGAAATIFMRQGDDFIRIATSLRMENGDRALGTPLGKDHPAHARVMAGERFIGKVRMFGKDFYTAYTPIKDKGGQIIGLVFVGLDVSVEMAALKQQIKAVKAGSSGYFFVLDSRPGKQRGTLIVHPAKEGQNILGAKDANGQEFIKEMLDKKKGVIRYPWMNPQLGETAAREKVSVFDEYPDWHWVIGGGTYIEEIQGVARELQRALALASLLAVLILVATIYWLIRHVNAPLDKALQTFRAISAGDYSTRIDVVRNDEIGKVMQGLQTILTRLGFELAENKRSADEALRIKVALDNVSTGVMIANSERNIIYANKSVQRILKGAEADIRKQLPSFDADHMIGTCIDGYHKNPAHQAGLLERLNGTHVANFEIGGRHLRVTANPVLSERGERLGAVAEWLDRTVEVLVERELANVVDCAQRGDFEKRLSLEGKEGFVRQLAEGLNRLAEVTSGGLQDVARVLKTVARGDLTQQIDADYEGIFGQLKDDTNTTVERLREVVSRIKDATEAINTAAHEIAAGNLDLSSRTEEQASSLEETSSSMAELNETVKHNAENANQANALARKSNEVASKGGEMVKRVVSTMSDIQGSSKKIADIIGVIDSIAFQTNILALNAAVEAARAGEQGRGFAVVATEVRQLAQRSATAAKEIKTLIAESEDKVESGAELVELAGDTMDEVVSSFQGVASLVTQIADASHEQSNGIEQVTQAIGQMDEVTQQNAALVEEAAAASESLKDQARGLMQAVGMFKLDDGRASSAGAARLAAPVRPATRLSAAAPTQGNGRVSKPGLPKPGSDAEEWEEF